MCGLTGIFERRPGGAADRALLGRMNDTLFHRGPDGDGLHVEGPIGLGHRRLAIIDLSGGAQPLYNEDHSVVVVYNGEIYNFPDLADDLAARGHVFRTRCDTEVIVHAWEEWGEDCVTRFRGMFAFALWDANTQTLFLARDRLGIKPLYYAEYGNGRLAFASELKALLADPTLPRKMDARAVEEYFAYGYVPDPATIYQGVYKLPPGHTLKVRAGEGSPVPREYWNVSFEGAERLDEEALAGELIEQLQEAVRIRLISEVPLGAFLSGGVDSSAVVALMANASSDPVNTCSIAFDDPSYDESVHAQSVAERYKTDHHVETVDPDAFDLVDKLAGMYDEPYADSSAMPTYRVCGLARKRVTVALSGDGGDELFAGYRRYRWHHYEERVRRLLPDPVRMPLFGLAGAVYPKADWAPKVLRAKSTLQAIGRDTTGGYFHSVSVLYDSIREKLYTPSFRNSLQDYHAVEVLNRHMASAPTEDHLSRAQYADLKTYLPGDILTKVDRASMAHSLEVRVPILDHKFVEWSAKVSPWLKLKGREGKYLLKKALEPHLPHDIMYRQKMGFAVPIGGWFRGPLKDKVREAVTGEILADTGILEPAYLKRLVDEHQSGQRDHSAVLWSISMFESFLRQVHAPSS